MNAALFLLDKTRIIKWRLPHNLSIWDSPVYYSLRKDNVINGQRYWFFTQYMVYCLCGLAITNSIRYIPCMVRFVKTILPTPRISRRFWRRACGSWRKAACSRFRMIWSPECTAIWERLSRNWRTKAIRMCVWLTQRRKSSEASPEQKWWLSETLPR